MPTLHTLPIEKVHTLLTDSYALPDDLKTIATKVLHRKRISEEDALLLFEKGSVDFLGVLADFVRTEAFGNDTFFNKNIHIEPTNVCIFSCKFCSYSCSYQHREEGWESSQEEMLSKLRSYDDKPITEVHIVGGVHPKMNFFFFEELLQAIHQHRPNLHIKAFTAVELDYMIRKAKLSIEEGLRRLQAAGLQSLPGGGAEIFDETIRKEICADKVDAKGWLNIHATAHRLGIPSNCTMLYGHIENYAHRVAHMQALRTLQDETQGFNTFIPLKFRNQHNEMSHIAELTLIEDMKMYAIARLFMDNIPHLKAYWPMLGRSNAQLALSFGVDDIDGTIDDSTKIYSMAGSEESTPTLSTEQLVTLIEDAGRTAVERDSIYRPLRRYANAS